MLRGSRKGARQGQICWAVSQKMSSPTLPIPLISLRRVRIFDGAESAAFRRLLRSLSDGELCQRRSRLSISLVAIVSTEAICLSGMAINVPYFSLTKSASSPSPVAVFSRYRV